MHILFNYMHANKLIHLWIAIFILSGAVYSCSRDSQSGSSSDFDQQKTTQDSVRERELSLRIEDIVNEPDPIIGNAKAYQFIQSCDEKDFDYIWSQYPKDVVRVRRSRTSSALLLKFMAERYPEKAMHYAESVKLEAPRQFAISSALSGWARIDFKAAFDWVKTSNHPQHIREQFIENILRVRVCQDHLDAFQIVEESFDVNKGRNIRFSILSEWVKHDPVNASAYLINHQEENDFQSAYTDITGLLAELDINETSRWISLIKNRDIRQSAQDALRHAQKALGMHEKVDSTFIAAIKNPAEKEKAIRKKTFELFRVGTEQAIAWIETLADKRDRDIAYLLIGDPWLDRDYADFRKHLDKFPAGRRRDELEGNLVYKWASESPEEAFAWVMKKPVGSHRGSLLIAVCWGAEEVDPWKAVILMSGLPEGLERDDALGAALQSVADDNPAKAIEYVIKQENEQLRIRLADDIIHYLTRNNPHQAIKFLSNFPESDDTRHMKAHLAFVWARMDFEAAKEWVLSMTDSVVRHKAVLAISSIWLKSDPASIKAYALSLANENERFEITRKLVNTISNDDPANAVQWIKSMSYRSMRDEFYPQAIGEWAFYEPKQASKFIDEMERGVGRNLSASALVHQWVESNSESAINWAKTFEPSEEAADLQADILAHWINYNNEAALSWVKDQKKGKELDLIIQKTLGHFHFVPTELSVGLIMLLTDPKVKTSNLISFFKTWIRIDSQAALEWLNDSNFPEDLKELLKKLDNDQEANPGIQEVDA